MRKLILASAVGALALGVATAGGAAASGSGGTATTFALTGGGLDITVPAGATLSSAVAGGSATGSLGSVTVTDSRSALGATWTAKVSSSEFTSSVAGAPAIPASNVSYWSGLATASTVGAAAVPGQATAANQASLGSSVTAFSVAGVLGNNSVTWNPTVVVAAPSSAIAGTYSGTITHSVA